MLKSFSKVCGRKYILEIIPDQLLVTHLALASVRKYQNSEKIVITSDNAGEVLVEVIGSTMTSSRSVPSSFSVGSFGNQLFMQEAETSDVLHSSFDTSSTNTLQYVYS